MADEETSFLRLAYQQTMNGGIQLKYTKEAFAATRARFVTDCQGLYDTLVTNVSAGLSTERHRDVVLASKHGFQPVYCEMGTVSSHAGR